MKMDLVQVHIEAIFPIYDGGKSWLDIIIAFGLLGGGATLVAMLSSMLLLGCSLKKGKDSLKHNEELVAKRPWIIWVVGFVSLGAMVVTVLWYFDGDLPPRPRHW